MGVTKRTSCTVGGDSSIIVAGFRQFDKLFAFRRYTATGEEWHNSLFNAQPQAPAYFVAGPGQAGACGWALNESISTGSGIETIESSRFQNCRSLSYWPAAEDLIMPTFRGPHLCLTWL